MFSSQCQLLGGCCTWTGCQLLETEWVCWSPWPVVTATGAVAEGHLLDLGKAPWAVSPRHKLLGHWCEWTMCQLQESGQGYRRPQLLVLATEVRGGVSCSQPWDKSSLCSQTSYWVWRASLSEVSPGLHTGVWRWAMGHSLCPFNWQ